MTFNSKIQQKRINMVLMHKDLCAELKKAVQDTRIYHRVCTGSVSFCNSTKRHTNITM